MTDLVGFGINVFLFVVLLTAIIGPVKSAFRLGNFPSYVLAVCVSALGIIGMNRFLRGSMEIVLLLYAAMAISILLALLFLFLSKHFKRTIKYPPDYHFCKGNPAKSKKKRMKRLKNG